MSLPFRRPLRRAWRACEGDAVGRAVRWSAPDVSSGPRAPPVESATATRKRKCIVPALSDDNQRSMITLVAPGRIAVPFSISRGIYGRPTTQTGLWLLPSFGSLRVSFLRLRIPRVHERTHGNRSTTYKCSIDRELFHCRLVKVDGLRRMLDRTRYISRYFQRQNGLDL